MACNCKKRYDDMAAAVGQDDKQTTEEWTLFGVARSVGMFFGQILFGIIAFIVIIVMAVPFFCYLIVALTTGRELTVGLKRNKRIKFSLNKRNKK